MISGPQRAAPVRPRAYSPSEFSAVLAEFGISLSQWSIRERCALPLSDPLHIRTLPSFPGRWFIPDSEAFRLIGLNSTEACA